MRLFYSIFLGVAVWQDFRSRKISVWLYILFAAIGIAGTVVLSECSLGDVAVSAVPGVVLLLLTWFSRGGIGIGDGCFFLISAVYLRLSEVIMLLFYGLLFCSAFSLGIVVWGCAMGVQVRKLRLPFLPFLLPAWIWLLIL